MSSFAFCAALATLILSGCATRPDTAGAVLAPAAIAPAPVVVPQHVVQPVAVTPTGYAHKFLYQAKSLPEVRACPFDPGVTLVAVSPGVEMYSAQCGRAEVLMLRCEWGTCRVLK